MKLNKNLLLKVGLVISLIAIYLYIPFINRSINQMVFYISMENIDAMKGYIVSFGAYATIISFILMVLQSVIAPLSSFIILLANATIFGWFYGALLSLASIMVGAMFCFYISKFLGRGIIHNITDKLSLDKADVFFYNYGKYIILIARLLPFISFDLVSYASGLTSMKFGSFFIATCIGLLPTTIAYSYVGGVLPGSSKNIMTSLLLLFSILIFIYMLKKMHKDKHNSNTINNINK